MAAPDQVDMQTLIQRGGCLHQLFVPSDKGDLELGPVLDDCCGPPSKNISSRLQVLDFTKDIAMVLSLRSFAFYSYQKHSGEKDFKQAFAGWVGYLASRRKAAKVILDKQGTVGYLWPEKPVHMLDGTPGVMCFYVPHGSDAGGGRAAAAAASPSSSVQSAASGESKKRPADDAAIGTNGSSLKRPRPARFQYVPPEPRQQLSEEDDLPYNPLGAGKDENVIVSTALPHPSQFPISTDLRFTYIPPTPPPGVEPPPGYFDPPAPPSTEWIVVDYETMLPADVVAKETASWAGSGGVSQDWGGGRAATPPSTGRGTASGWGRGRGRAMEVASGEDQRTAASFYDRLNRDKNTRNQSLIFHLRKLNNWVKGHLIAQATPVGAGNKEIEILDLACGKGGDFPKYEMLAKTCRIERYVGIDIARASLVDAIGRYSKQVSVQRALGAAVTLACADLGSTDLINDEVEIWRAADQEWVTEQLLDESDAFDLISMQFALHYMFETEERARRFLAVVARHLKPGGTFVATTVDARVVVELLAAKAVKEKNGDIVARLEDDQQRVLLKVQVDSETYDKIFRRSLDEPSPEAGLRYWFTLSEGGSDEDGSDAVNAPEWLIPLPYLVRLAKEVGLELEYAKNFHELVDELRHEQDDRKKGTQGIGRWVNYKGSINEAEWQLARIYTALKFKKRRK